VLLGLEREGVRVHTGHGGTGVVVEGLHLVEVLTGLLLEAVLTVEHKLHRLDGTDGLLIEGSRGGTGTGQQLGSVTGIDVDSRLGASEVNVRDGSGHNSIRILSEVPQGTVGLVRLGGAPHELLHGVVVRQADLLGLLSRGESIGTGVLDLLDEVLVTLLGETTTLLGVKVDVVGPHLEGLGRIHVRLELRREVEVEADLVVLQRNEGKRETGVAVEEENQGKELLTVRTGSRDNGTSGHLTPRSLLSAVEVQLGVQAPPLLVVLVDALTTDGELNVLDRTLGDPLVGEGTIVIGNGGERSSLHLDVHVSDEVTVTSDGDGNATGVSGSTVDGLLDVLHREVGVAAVDRLEESNLGVASQVDILGTISDELHETTGHCELLYYIPTFFLSREKHGTVFPHLT